MGIVAASDDVETGLLHHAHVAPHCLLGNRVAPAGLVLMHIGPAEEKVLPVQEESLVSGPAEPPESEGCLVAVYEASSLVEFANQHIQFWIRR